MSIDISSNSDTCETSSFSASPSPLHDEDIGRKPSCAQSIGNGNDGSSRRFEDIDLDAVERGIGDCDAEQSTDHSKENGTEEISETHRDRGTLLSLLVAKRARLLKVRNTHASGQRKRKQGPTANDEAKDERRKYLSSFDI